VHRFLEASLEGSPNMVHSGIRHRRQTRTLAFSNAKFLPECLPKDINK